MQSIVMTISVCLSVRKYNSKTARPNFIIFLCLSPVVVALSSSDGVATCRLCTSGFVDGVMRSYDGGYRARIKHDVMFSTPGGGINKNN